MISEYIKTLLPSTWSVTIGDLPAANSEAIALMEYSGGTSTEYFGTKQDSSVFNPLVKIVTRVRDYTKGKEQMEEAKSILHRFHDDTILSCLLVGAPIYLGRNEQKMHEFQVTFRIQVKE